ncbi:MAG: hypothetical protein R3C05_01215 [Pirellulaceae bacterium]
MKNLPDGVTAGVKIAAGQSRGIMLITADQDAPRGLSMASFSGTSELNGEQVVRPVHLATMKRPVTNAWSEIPEPRLVPTIPVSVGGSEYAAFTLASTQDVIDAAVTARAIGNDPVASRSTRRVFRQCAGTSDLWCRV